MRRSKRSAFTLLEVLCAIAIIAVLAGLVAAVFVRVRESGRRTVCLKNLTQISAAIHLYAAEHDGRFPIVFHFEVPLAPYVREPSIFDCPTAMAEFASKHPGRTTTNKFSYFISLSVNRYIFEPDGHVHTEAKSEAEMPNPVRTILAGDMAEQIGTGGSAADWRSQVKMRHSSGSNYVFIDGHAEWLAAEAAYKAFEVATEANGPSDAKPSP